MEQCRCVKKIAGFPKGVRNITQNTFSAKQRGLVCVENNQITLLKKNQKSKIVPFHDVAKRKKKKLTT